ncbi:DUF5130 family protein [Raineyella fluvialis]|uniref:DUF5130 family protein n=1 Tax=Raineyella fluvialis TaxID=2662261 RepID=A0A5Q2F5Y9_9ACTN|nr:DUF5130 family protein [Raineyella fluvialis]QGF22370.1 DUF5130 family protein [Raineyella fluvialis]
MLIGDRLSPSDVKRVAWAIQQAEEISGYTFVAYLAEHGAEGGVDGRARALHATLADRDRAVLVYVDPQLHEVSVVTGVRAARTLADSSCAFATATMASSFAAGDLAGGLVGGIIQLGEAARSQASQHLRPSVDR